MYSSSLFFLSRYCRCFIMDRILVRECMPTRAASRMASDTPGLRRACGGDSSRRRRRSWVGGTTRSGRGQGGAVADHTERSARCDAPAGAGDSLQIPLELRDAVQVVCPLCQHRERPRVRGRPCELDGACAGYRRAQNPDEHGPRPHWQPQCHTPRNTRINVGLPGFLYMSADSQSLRLSRYVV